jgi:hypothetical protein
MTLELSMASRITPSIAAGAYLRPERGQEIEILIMNKLKKFKMQACHIGAAFLRFLRNLGYR